MRYVSCAVIVISMFLPTESPGAARLMPYEVTVGRNLLAAAEVGLGLPAGEGGLPIRLTSSDPALVLLSATPDGSGSASITVTARPGTRSSPEFYVIGAADSGIGAYTASAPGFESAEAEVRLAPSAFVFTRAAVGVPGFRTTTGAAPVEIAVQSARLDASLKYVAMQPVAGGRPLTVQIVASNPDAGRIVQPALVFQPGLGSVATEFRSGSPGSTRLELKPPPGFTTPAGLVALQVEVTKPGIAATGDVAIGRHLQIEGILSLGEPAPQGGVAVLLESQSDRLLLAASKHVEGSRKLQMTIPAGGFGASYYLQALGDQGTVTYTASAPGFVSRTATVTLTPSGIVIGGPQGPPDEAELVRKEAVEQPKGFVTSLAAGHAMPIAVYTVQLDPVTRRGADVTVQPLRANVAVKIRLSNENPAIGSAPEILSIPAGAYSAASQFVPKGVGSTVLSVVAPEGFVRPANSSALTVIVRP